MLPVLALAAQHGESEEKASDPGARYSLTTPVPARSLITCGRAVLERANS